MDFETIAREIVDSAIRVHTRLGPGMLESAYEACIEYELGKRALAVKKQVRAHARRHQARRKPAITFKQRRDRDQGSRWGGNSVEALPVCQPWRPSVFPRARSHRIPRCRIASTILARGGFPKIIFLCVLSGKAF
ncbi:MAG: GxxExxY protein [Betaproteobacteria bacterium]|nr:GxxExxY protein [Betaproteobacteria bacterium]